MAEDEADLEDLIASEPKTRKVRKPQHPSPPQNEKCRSRIDQLAIPSRRLILALYQNHSDHLPKEKVEKIKALLQELYAMTPEETQTYFQHLKKQELEANRRKDIKFMLKKLVRRKKRAKQTKKAYNLINHLLVQSMEYALKHPVPPLVSVRLRNLSNIVLEQISDMMNVKVPDREQPDPLGYFLIQVADWTAIAIEHLYYGVQLKKNQELQKLAAEAKAREQLNKEKIEPPGGQSEDEHETGGSEAVLSEALLVSEME
ncbi:hypothetical protein HUJ04_013269 [Dendroctonus ponderosae]